jgi:uncharacterized protein (TIGR02302 family)
MDNSRTDDGRTENRSTVDGAPDFGTPARPSAPKLGLRRTLARLSLFWETTWPALWPSLGLIGAFLALALFNLLPALPGWLHALVLVAFATSLLLTIRSGLRQLRIPSAATATRRLETDSGLEHRPLVTIDDRPATSVSDPQTERLWQLHLARAAAAARNIHLRWPRPNLAARDPYALRGALLITLVAGFVIAGPNATARLSAALSPDLSALTAREAASLELWITPPEHTNLPPMLLASADPDNLSEAVMHGEGPIAVPAGSTLLAQVNAGRSTPELERGDSETKFVEVADRAWRLEATLDTEGVQDLSVVQSGNTLGAWELNVIGDTPPQIQFSEAPSANDSNALRIGYNGLDDYGITAARAELAWPGDPGLSGIQAIDLELPLPRPDARDGSAASLHDLTAHPWAGLEVDIQLTATDGIGQTGQTDRLSVILPERVFNHPIAREIIAQRRVLALSPENRRDVARSLHNLGRFPDRFDNNIAVFLALMSARSRLIYAPESEGVVGVLSQLWDTALRLEDGSLSLAQRDVANLQERLREAIESGATDEEISAIMEELRAALDRYLEALAQNLSQALEGMDLSSLPEAGEDMELLDREAIQEMMEQLEQMARLGDAEGVREMLERMQQMLQALQNAPNMMQQQQSSPAQQFLRELQQVLRNQEALHDETFQRSQRGQEMTPSESREAREAQNEIRRQLGEMMRQLGEMTNEIPENLGDAEGAMSDAEGALGEGDLQSALNDQTRAMDELRRGGQQMALQMMRQSGQGQGEGQGQAEGLFQPGQEGFDPLGRPTEPDDRNDGDARSAGQNPIGDGEQALRALKIQDEIRQRLRDQGRPEAEIDYLLRLLRRF